ncbi:hypothetical protein D9757_004274 [Collybiopsis confluens]|uniref:Smr domain-containing protein n=1 Tax=Collybiopsis confluens TaxID=2823264 RepID=A0A8H5MD00_9AGAR|nr:hypothetical protein D9757_004274 [Collybiopsis confluens]
MDILVTMIFGLGLRFVLSEHAQAKSYPAILGLWEGACLRYLNNQAPSTIDPYLSYAVRLSIDFFVTSSNFPQILAIAVWSFLGALALEAIEAGNSVASPVHTDEASLTKMKRVSVPPFLSSSSTGSHIVDTISPFSPVVHRAEESASISPLSFHLTGAGQSQLPQLPPSDLETRSSDLHGSYSFPVPALFEPQSPQITIPELAVPILVMERETSSQDELQTPMGNSDIAIQDDNQDELQTPLALPISHVPFGDFDEPSRSDIGPSMLLDPPDIIPVPILPSSGTSPLPVPIPALIHSTTLESPLSTLHTISKSSSSTSSPPVSVLSVTSPTRMYARGDELRKQAWKEERAKLSLESQLRSARADGRTKDVFLLIGEIKATRMRIERLHMRAKRRYYQARNKHDSNTLQIDVHGLLIQEAVEETEEAFRDVLRNGHRFLRIIVGRGTHSRDGVPKLKPAIIQAMEQLSL